MAFTFEVIYLGTLPRIDTTQFNETMESAGAILGTYGTADAPLSTQVTSLAGQGFLIFQNTSYDVSNLLGYDTFRINGGSLQNFDGWANYNALVTYSDGSTATITAIVIQDTNGKSYLVPEQTANTDQTALTAKPILSLTLQSVVATTGDLSADRVAGDFKAAVDGTAGNDLMNVGYTDAQGDAVSASHDDIMAGAGNDTVNSGAGNDFINAGDGNDVVSAGDGNDRLRGGAGNDSLSGDAGADTLEGGTGDDTLIGGDGADSLLGESGNDLLNGGLGADSMWGGDGADRFFGGAGDSILGGEGGTDADTLFVEYGSGVVYGGGNNEAGTVNLASGGTLSFAEIETIRFIGMVDGSAGNDVMGIGFTDSDGDVMADGADRIDGGAGDDNINAGGGNDTIFGGSGNDTIDDWAGSDLVYAGAGNDIVDVSVGNDTLYMEDGDDVVNIWDNAGQNTFFGGAGKDRLDFQNWQSSTGSSVTFTANGAGTFSHLSGATTGSFSEFESVSGSAFADTLNASVSTFGVTMDGEAGNDLLIGGSGSDVLLGGDGDDTLVGGAGADVLTGGTGRDSADYSASAAGVTVNLLAGTGLGGDAQGDTLSGVDNIIGSSNADVLTLHNTSGIVYGGGGADSLFGGAGNGDQLYGGDGGDVIDGKAGNDSLFGGAGNDTLFGGLGNDTLTGGDGEDTIILTVSGGADRITDFNMTVVNGRTVDQIDVSELSTPDGGPIRSTDVTISDTNGNGTGDAILTFAGGESIILVGVTVADLATPSALLTLGIPCFVSGTPILTPQGWRRVETLGRDDLVVTTEGPQRILWTGSRSLSGDDLAQHPDQKPIHFPSGSIGNTQPLRLSPQHAVLMRTPTAGLVLVRAKHLAELGFGGARVAQGVRDVCYHHILMERHAVICAAGAAAESFYPGPHAIEMLDWPARLALAAAIAPSRALKLPLCADDFARQYGDRVHPLLTRKGLRGLTVVPFIPSGARQPEFVPA